MKKLFTTIASALALMATPALAQTPVIGTAEVIGSTQFKDDVSYGVRAGLNTPVAPTTLLGVEASAEDFIEDGDRTLLYGGVRLTQAVAPTTSLFGTAGYVNRERRGDNDEGYRLGAGVEQNVAPRTFVRVGYQYTDFGRNVDSHAGTIGLGLRF